MTSKKRRQRGKTTHGGGSHKNRRGAGNRGGRGRAGRAKHEFHNYEPLGKHGFNRPDKAQRTVETVDLQKIDEDIALYVDEGIAEETDDGYRIDARDVAETTAGVDAVKLLGGGQLFNTLEVVADDFTDSAEELLESEGGAAVLSERGEELAEAKSDPEEPDADEGGEE
jgi:large subunit ribosomal protein L15